MSYKNFQIWPWCSRWCKIILLTINNHKTCQNKASLFSSGHQLTRQCSPWRKGASKARPQTTQQSAWGPSLTVVQTAGFEQSAGVPLSSQGRNQSVGTWNCWNLWDKDMENREREMLQLWEKDQALKEDLFWPYSNKAYSKPLATAAGHTGCEGCTPPSQGVLPQIRDDSVWNKASMDSRTWAYNWVACQVGTKTHQRKKTKSSVFTTNYQQWLEFNQKSVNKAKE